MIALAAQCVVLAVMVVIVVVGGVDILHRMKAASLCRIASEASSGSDWLVVVMMPLAAHLVVLTMVEVIVVVGVVMMINERLRWPLCCK